MLARELDLSPSSVLSLVEATKEVERDCGTVLTSERDPPRESQLKGLANRASRKPENRPTLDVADVVFEAKESLFAVESPTRLLRGDL
jgi:hypothetical protein